MVKCVESVSRVSPDYPPLLSKVADAPGTLYFLGDYKASLFINTLAVVGSRAVTMYGEWVVNNIVKEVARNGITIVSGFMYGVDALAHRTTLEVGGSTIAVMAGGVEKIFPAYQEQLYFDIVDKGLVISEYYENFVGGGWMFARRNRIVAGLSHAVLVVEAAENSGSLITASYAKQYDRQVLTVPANLNSQNSFGTTQLLRDGAKLITCADDILQLFDNDSRSSRLSVADAVNKRLLLDLDSKSILDLLYSESLSADELSSKLNVLSSDVLKCLTGLSVLGHVREHGGRYYAC